MSGDGGTATRMRSGSGNEDERRSELGGGPAAGKEQKRSERQKQLDMSNAQETLDIVYEMAELLDVGLDKKTLSILIALCEHGVNPEALAAAVKELQREASEYKKRERH